MRNLIVATVALRFNEREQIGVDLILLLPTEFGGCSIQRRLLAIGRWNADISNGCRFSPRACSSFTSIVPRNDS
jgi:hypothetical protein